MNIRCISDSTLYSQNPDGYIFESPPYTAWKDALFLKKPLQKHRHLTRYFTSLVPLCFCRAGARRRRKSASFQASPHPLNTPYPSSYQSRSAGKYTAATVPSFTTLSTSISAPCSIAACFTMESPSPVPPISRERPLSTR